MVDVLLLLNPSIFLMLCVMFMRHPVARISQFVKNFFPQLEQTLKDLNLTNYITGGHLNCILDDSLDRNIPPAANSEGVKLLLFISSVNCNGKILILVITPSL